MFLNALKEETNFTLTTNGAVAHKSTLNKLMDLFAMGAAYRWRDDSDCILLFKEAYEENPEYALKCLFYIRDILDGAGERKFFRVCFKWLAQNYPEVARRNMRFVPMLGRWDDLYCLVDTPIQKDMFKFMEDQFKLDLISKTPSLLAKWLKSPNTSSKESVALARLTYAAFGMSERHYRRALSYLRKKINVLERLMSTNQWDKIEFDKIPSAAGLKYRNAFAEHEVTRAKYEAFAKDKKTKVNAKALFPYQVVKKAFELSNYYNLEDTERLMINKYWDNLTDYFNSATLNALCMVDTSGSMFGDPINIAISLGLYCAERAKGPFANHYISFSSRPQLIECRGVDFCDKVYRIYHTNLCQNTNIKACFDLLLNTALNYHMKQEDLPQNIIIVSDMQVDCADEQFVFHKTTLMEGIRRKWALAGYKMPHLIYWNVNAIENTILDSDPDVSYVSGASPSIFESILTGKTGYELMMNALNKDKYKEIK